MEWNQKGSVLWDWENFPPIGANATEKPKIVPQAEPNFVSLEDARHESVHSSCLSFSSSSEMGYGSSKSFISASIDSSPKVGNNVELNLGPVKEPVKNTGKDTHLGEVDDARASPSSIIAVSSEEPVIGLKLGKRTYFEDACGGQSIKSSPSDTSAVTPASAKKAKVARNTQNPYCQVEGCKVDLSSATDYYRKHKVCQPHSKFPKVVVGGLERRFCQQCSRFHALAEFDHKKQSCRRRLNDHNARRRKPQPEAISFGSSNRSSMFYDARQQTSLLFGQAPYGQIRSYASTSWDNPAGFKFAETKAAWLKPTRSTGVDGMQDSGQQAWNSIMPDTMHHDFDGIAALKGIETTVLNQALTVLRHRSFCGGVQSDQSPGPSLCSLSSVKQFSRCYQSQQTPQLQPGLSTLASSSSLVMPASYPGLWQDDMPLDNQVRFQALDPLSNSNSSAIAAPHQLQHPGPPSYNGSSSHYDQMY